MVAKRVKPNTIGKLIWVGYIPHRKISSLAHSDYAAIIEPQGSGRMLRGPAQTFFRRHAKQRGRHIHGEQQ